MNSVQELGRCCICGEMVGSYKFPFCSQVCLDEYDRREESIFRTNVIKTAFKRFPELKKAIIDMQNE